MLGEESLGSLTCCLNLIRLALKEKPLAADDSFSGSEDVPFDYDSQIDAGSWSEPSIEVDAIDVDAIEVDAIDDGRDETEQAEQVNGEIDAEVEALTDPFDFAGRNSQPYIGQWNRLVSRTNWEKGQIISEWRQSLMEASAPATAYSDEVWARLVGGVTSQHVGRLRRVFVKFGSSFESYAGLFWTHFQAALDWQDAEMWLQGAVESRWSVSQMRRQRWEALGGIAAEEPQDDEIVAADLDEDFEPANDSRPEKGEFDEASAGARYEEPDFGGDSDDSQAQESSEAIGSDFEDVSGTVLAEAKPAFEQIGKLPEDLAEALESFQIAIIHHRTLGWTDVTQAQVIAAIDGLKHMVRSDAEGRIEIEG